LYDIIKVGSGFNVNRGCKLNLSNLQHENLLIMLNSKVTEISKINESSVNINIT
jgi:hypothetical protein